VPVRRYDDHSRERAQADFVDFVSARHLLRREHHERKAVARTGADPDENVTGGASWGTLATISVGFTATGRTCKVSVPFWCMNRAWLLDGVAASKPHPLMTATDPGAP